MNKTTKVKTNKRVKTKTNTTKKKQQTKRPEKTIRIEGFDPENYHYSKGFKDGYNTAIEVLVSLTKEGEENDRPN